MAALVAAPAVTAKDEFDTEVCGAAGCRVLSDPVEASAVFGAAVYAAESRGIDAARRYYLVRLVDQRDKRLRDYRLPVFVVANIVATSDAQAAGPLRRGLRGLAPFGAPTSATPAASAALRPFILIAAFVAAVGSVFALRRVRRSASRMSVGLAHARPQR